MPLAAWCFHRFPPETSSGTLPAPFPSLSFVHPLPMSLSTLATFDHEISLPPFPPQGPLSNVPVRPTTPHLGLRFRVKQLPHISIFPDLRVPRHEVEFFSPGPVFLGDGRLAGAHHLIILSQSFNTNLRAIGLDTFAYLRGGPELTTLPSDPHSFGLIDSWLGQAVCERLLCVSVALFVPGLQFFVSHAITPPVALIAHVQGLFFPLNFSPTLWLSKDFSPREAALIFLPACPPVH